jgi:hypothetical protein
MDDRLSSVWEIADTVSAQMEAHEQLDRSFTAVQMRLSQMETDIFSQADEIATVRSVTESTEKDLGLMQVRLSRGECDIDRLASEVQGFRTHSEVTAQQLTDCETKLNPLEVNVLQMKTAFSLFKAQINSTIISPVGLPLTLQFNSLIVSDIASPFAEFREKQFVLLWRGSRDGFNATDFHSRCDGHANTLTLILDTDGNIFGGFTPVEWESASWKYKCDNSLRSFLFTLKNPHNTPAMTFALKPEKKEYAIYAHSSCCPIFGGGHDLRVHSQCNTNTNSYTHYIGHTYTNNSGVANDKLFTGSTHFKVKEIEVFEITVYTASSSNHIPFTDSPVVAHCGRTHSRVFYSLVCLNAADSPRLGSSSSVPLSLPSSHLSFVSELFTFRLFFEEQFGLSALRQLFLNHQTFSRRQGRVERENERFSFNGKHSRMLTNKSNKRYPIDRGGRTSKRMHSRTDLRRAVSNMGSSPIGQLS